MANMKDVGLLVHLGLRKGNCKVHYRRSIRCLVGGGGLEEC